MANLSRLLNNIYKYDKDSRIVLDNIEKQTHLLGARTPIPNQALPTLLNNSGDELAQITFTEDSYDKLRRIRSLEKLITQLFKTNSQNPPNINFFCTGYRDFDGDIIINQIVCPILDMASHSNFKSHQEIYNYLFSQNYKNLNEDTIAYAYENMRLADFTISRTGHIPQEKENILPIGTHSVVLIGTTRSQEGLGELATCCNLRELAESIIPDVPVACNNLITGSLLITPDIQVRTGKETKEQSAYTLQPGSLECTIATYYRSEKTGKVHPYRLDNITRAAGLLFNGETENIRISSSPQNLGNIERAPSRSLNFEPTM